jgi:predicted DsbA family dithiol-disulfide isomerase
LSAENPIRFVAYSDYLCPWCYNAAVRLRRLEETSGGSVEVEWRSFLLRPRPDPSRSLEKFRRYTRSWLRPAAEPDSGTFRVWEGDAGPPSHSVPPHLAAKAAAGLGPEAFRRMHERLLYAYFAENRDITERATLHELWKELQLDERGFERLDDPALLSEVIQQHNEALECGASGVPAVRMQGIDAVIVGAQPLDFYTRWIERIRARRAEAGAP